METKRELQIWSINRPSFRISSGAGLPLKFLSDGNFSISINGETSFLSSDFQLGGLMIICCKYVDPHIMEECRTEQENCTLWLFTSVLFWYLIMAPLFGKQDLTVWKFLLLDFQSAPPGNTMQCFHTLHGCWQIVYI